MINIAAEDLWFVPVGLILLWGGGPIVGTCRGDHHHRVGHPPLQCQDLVLAAVALLIWAGVTLLMLLSLGTHLATHTCELHGEFALFRTQLLGLSRTRRYSKADIRRTRTEVRDWRGRGGLRATLVRVVLETDRGDLRPFPRGLSVRDGTMIGETIAAWIAMDRPL